MGYVVTVVKGSRAFISYLDAKCSSLVDQTLADMVYHHCRSDCNTDAQTIRLNAKITYWHIVSIVSQLLSLCYLHLHNNTRKMCKVSKVK